MGLRFARARTRIRTRVIQGLWVALFSLVFLFSTVVMGGEAFTLRLRQAYPLADGIKVYFDLVDGKEEQVRDLTQDQLELTVSLGKDPANVAEVKPFVQTDEGVAYIFLVDLSKSLTEKEFQAMKKAMGIWVDSLTEKDRAAVVTFGETVQIAQEFTGDQTVLQKAIDVLHPKDMKTQLHRGVAKAIELGRRSDPNLPTRRAIITLSDGREDFTGGMVKDEVLAMLKEDRIPLYALGFYRPPLSEEKQKYLDTLGEFARRSGGDYYQMNSTSISESYSKIRRRILGSYVARVDCQKQVMDGSVYHLRLNLSQDGKALSDGLDLRLLPVVGAQEQESPGGSGKGWFFLGIIVLIIITGAFVVVFFKSKAVNSDYPVDEIINEDESSFEVEKPVLPGIKLKIITTGKNQEDQAFEVKLVDRITIGREKAGNELCLKDQEISRRHCEITRQDELVFIFDLESRNGTFVNGVPIAGRHRLENGDLVQIGRTELRISFSPEIIE